MKIILLLLVSLILYPFVGLGNEERTNPPNFYGDPSYIVVVHTSNPHVNQGDIFNAQLYISGSGNVDISRILVSIPPYLVTPESNKVTQVAFVPVDSENNTFRASYTITEDSGPRFHILLPDILYRQEVVSKSESGEEITHGVKFGELKAIIDGKSYSPVSFAFVINDNAPGGDHNIIINYMYKYQNRWYSDDQILTLHVNRFYEKNVVLYNGFNYFYIEYNSFYCRGWENIRRYLESDYEKIITHELHYNS